jgi:hypothetical protein
VGIGRALRLVRESERLGVPREPATTRRRPSPVIRSPFQSSTLTAIVYADIFDNAVVPLSRAHAMAVPAMARCRHILCGFGARAPLKAYQDETELAEQPPWTYRTDVPTMLPPFHRMLWTIDDVLFSGWSMWAVARYEDGQHVRDAARVPIDWWHFDEDGEVKFGDNDIPYDDVILIPGPHEGVLNFGQTAIRHASRLMRAAGLAGDNPTPQIDLHDEGETQLTDDEIDSLTARWADARRGENGGVAYTSKGINAKPLGQHEGAFLIDARNAAAVDVARSASVPAATIDATLDKSSLTYETTEGRNGQLIDYGLNMYLDAIAARLSMDDVVPAGTRIGFDLESIAGSALPLTGPSTED